MSYRRFEDLPVWLDAVRLAVALVEMADAGSFRRPSGLQDQILRAVVSISNNVAEGFERGSVDELIAFLYYAKGSAAEVRSMLRLLARIEPAGVVPDLAAATHLSESISKQLGAWIASQKSSEVQGPRILNNMDRNRQDQMRRSRAFEETMRIVRERAPRYPEPSREASQEER